MKAIGYIRVSTEKQATEGISLGNQQERIRAYCQYKGFELVDTITDAGVSGSLNKARSGFIDLLNQIDETDIDVVILYENVINMNN